MLYKLSCKKGNKILIFRNSFYKWYPLKFSNFDFLSFLGRKGAFGPFKHPLRPHEYFSTDGIAPFKKGFIKLFPF